MSRVTEIRYVGYALPDLEAERAFYTDQWKLVEAGEKDGMIYFAAEGGTEPCVVRLRRSEQKRIDVIALATDSRADVDELHARVTAAGCGIIFAPKALDTLGGGYGFRFFSPDGMPFEISSDVARRTPREIARWEGIPETISHVVLHSPDLEAAVAFFTDVLGFRITDWVNGFMCFLRCNSAHHRIAFLKGEACLNHAAYDMVGVDDMMAGIHRLKQHGTDVRWGPGRHTAGDNTFSYFVTPGGFTVEYTAELEHVDFEGYESKTYPFGPDTVDRWGIGMGGPQVMPKPEADAGLFNAVTV